MNECGCENSNEEKALTPAVPVCLGSLIDYARGSIVSQAIVDTKAGTISLFSFDIGQGLSEHTAPFDALVQILDGRAELTIGGKPVEAQAGQTVLMPAEVPHSLRAPERFKMLLTMIRGKSE